MKTLGNILSGALVVLLVAVAGMFLATLAPFPGNIEAKIVQSGSMEPNIPVGALVVIKPFETYDVGQVITFGQDTRTKIPTTHRIESVRQEGGVTYYTTKGDANEEADAREVLHGEVIGRVVLSVPYIGFVLDFARKPLGFALLIGLPAAIIIFDELFNIFAEVRKLRQPRPRTHSKSPRVSRTGSKLPVGPDFSREPSGSVRAFEDIRVVYTRRRVSDDMFVRRPLAQAGRAFLSVFAAFGISSTLLLGNVGATVSYFNDLERAVENILRAGEWGPQADPSNVVLNEFLPNPDASANGLNLGDDGDNKPFGEWVELYNKGDVPVDVAGWFLTDASGGLGNTHAVISNANTNTGQTIVPAHGWLVVYMNKPTLNNVSDEIRLFMSSSTQIDAVSYGSPGDFCEFELTPGAGNAGDGSGVPGNGNSGDCNQALVPPNKSYARIPDGVGAWVDPVPTPGGPNTLDENAAYEEFVIIEEDAGDSPGGGFGAGGGSEPGLAEEPTGEAASSTPEAPESSTASTEIPPGEAIAPVEEETEEPGPQPGVAEEPASAPEPQEEPQDEPEPPAGGAEPAQTPVVDQ